MMYSLIIKRVLFVSVLLQVFITASYGANHKKSILVVLTGVDYITSTDGKKHTTGYWLEEFSTPYKIFTDRGFKTTVATPKGNRPSADPSSMAVGENGKAIYWSSQKEYLEALKIKSKVLDKRKIHNLSSFTEKDFSTYDAIFFPGGHAPMEDLAVDKDVARALKHFHTKKKTTALVCHGTIAILSTVDTKGSFPYKGYKVSAFSNEEEVNSEVGKYLKITPETALKKAGVLYQSGPAWMPFIVEDRELITGQNPASSKKIAEAVIKRLSKE